MKRYQCPRCKTGRLGPDKLDPEDSRGYCFGCSDETGKLVRVIAPSVESMKAERARKRAEKAAARLAAAEHREWTRVHTWPGVRELRWKTWSAGVPRLPNQGAMPIVRARSTIGGHYAEMFRLGLPRLPETGDTSKAVQARMRFLRRLNLEADDVLAQRAGLLARQRLNLVHDLAYGSDRLWQFVYTRLQETGVDLLIEDLAIEDPVAKVAIRGVAERADLQKPDDIKSLNNIILNAFDLAKVRRAPTDEDDLYDVDNSDDDGHEPIGGWQGA